MSKTEEYLKAPCPYSKPPFMYLGGHSFCPCVQSAIRAAYIEGWKDHEAKREPQVGRPGVEEKPDGND